MFGIGMPEMILILAVALIVIGPKKLPDLAKSLGRALGEFKKATNELKDSLQIDDELKEVKTTFDEINRDLKDNRPVAPNPEKSDAAENAAAEAESDSALADKDPLDKVKAAFNRGDDKPKSDTAAPDRMDQSAADISKPDDHPHNA